MGKRKVPEWEHVEQHALDNIATKYSKVIHDILVDMTNNPEYMWAATYTFQDILGTVVFTPHTMMKSSVYGE